jgi:putative transposase
MKKGRFSEEQMVGTLCKAAHSPVAQVAKKHGISEQTIYTWRQRFAGMSADDVKRLRLLEQENTELKKILAERGLEIEVMKEIAAKKMVDAS